MFNLKMKGDRGRIGEFRQLLKVRKFGQNTLRQKPRDVMVGKRQDIPVGSEGSFSLHVQAADAFHIEVETLDASRVEDDCSVPVVGVEVACLVEWQAIARMIKGIRAIFFISRRFTGLDARNGDFK